MNTNLVKNIKSYKNVVAPEWAVFVKTGQNKQRPPVNPNWWVVRVASVLRKVNKFGPIGANRLSKHYGGRKNRGHKPDIKCNASRNILRKCLQQLESEGLIKQNTEGKKSGKIITKGGRDLISKSEK